MNRLPNSAFADPKARRYPIPDEHHVRTALLAISWQLNHLRDCRKQIPYLREVHSRVIDRAKELDMKLIHNCELCSDKEKVEFT